VPTPLKKAASSDAAPTEALPEVKLDTVIQAFSAPIADLQENVRKAVEKAFADPRGAYDKAKVAAEEATRAVESSYSTAAKGIVEFNAKALQALRANAEANLDFIKSAIGVKSVSELTALQREHASRQLEAISVQAKEIVALAQRVASESAEPIKGHVAKTFKIAV
jgi:phasin